MNCLESALVPTLAGQVRPATKPGFLKREACQTTKQNELPNAWRGGLQVRRVGLRFSRRQTVETARLPISRARESLTSFPRGRRFDRRLRLLNLLLAKTHRNKFHKTLRRNTFSLSPWLNRRGSGDYRQCSLTRIRTRSIIPANNGSALKKRLSLSWLSSSRTKRNVRWIRAANPATIAPCAAQEGSNWSARILRADPGIRPEGRARMLATRRQDACGSLTAESSGAADRTARLPRTPRLKRSGSFLLND
jgi:hypothetical protein